jgi:hypothetical protein
VVRNHEGGTRMGRLPIQRRNGLRGNAEHGHRGDAAHLWNADSSIQYDGGAIFGQPQERKPGFAAGSQGPERVGKVGIKVRRVAYVNMQIMTCEPVEGPRGPMRGDAHQGRGGQQ